MEFEIRLGTKNDIDALERLYDELNDSLAAGVNYPGWKKGVYPTRLDAEQGVSEGCLYVAARGVNHERLALVRAGGPAHGAISVPFVVSAKHSRLGVGSKMLDFAARLAAKRGVKALRLDVYEKNAPAIALYKKCGFRYVATVSLGLEQYGLDWFELYEKPIF